MHRTGMPREHGNGSEVDKGDVVPNGRGRQPIAFLSSVSSFMPQRCVTRLTKDLVDSTSCVRSRIAILSPC